jgi:hypothetical protein
LVYTMPSVLSSCVLVTAVLWTIDRGVVTVDVHMVEQLASLDLFVASLWLIRTLDGKIIQDVEQKLRSRTRTGKSSRTATGWADARILVPTGCAIETVATEVVIAVGDNNRVDKGAPADGTHEVAVVCRHIVQGSQVDSFLHAVCYMDALSDVQGTICEHDQDEKEQVLDSIERRRN